MHAHCSHLQIMPVKKGLFHKTHSRGGCPLLVHIYAHAFASIAAICVDWLWFVGSIECEVFFGLEYYLYIGFFSERDVTFNRAYLS